MFIGHDDSRNKFQSSVNVYEYKNRSTDLNFIDEVV